MAYRCGSELRDGWLHVTNKTQFIALDCRAADDEPVSVWHSFQGSRPMFASIGDMVLFWIALIDDGHMYWENGTWQMREPMRDDVLFASAACRPTEPAGPLAVYA